MAVCMVLSLLDISAAAESSGLTVSLLTSIDPKTAYSTPIEVDGSNGGTLYAKATTDGVDVSGSVTWSVADELGYQFGVSISNNGEITIAPTAPAGTYTVTATLDGEGERFLPDGTVSRAAAAGLLCPAKLVYHNSRKLHLAEKTCISRRNA